MAEDRAFNCLGGDVCGTGEQSGVGSRNLGPEEERRGEERRERERERSRLDTQ